MEKSVKQLAAPATLNDSTKLKEIIELNPSYDALVKLGLAKLGDLAKENIKSVDAQKNAADTLRSSARAVGKVLAAMKTTHAEAQAAKAVGKGVTFEDYHKERTGSKPWNRALQCARVFDELVLVGFITEKDYDYSATDWLEKASSIIGELKEKGLPLNEGDGKEMIDILCQRPSDGAKKLRLLNNRLKGKETVSETGEGPTLDAASFVALLKRGMSMEWNASPGFSFVFTELCLLAKTVQAMKPEYAAIFHAAVKTLSGETADNATPTPQPIVVEVVSTPAQAVEIKQSKKAKAKKSAPVPTPAAPDFAAHAKALYDMEDELLVASVKAYFTEKGSLPDTSATLDAWEDAKATAEVPA